MLHKEGEKGAIVPDSLIALGNAACPRLHENRRAKLAFKWTIPPAPARGAASLSLILSLSLDYMAPKKSSINRLLLWKLPDMMSGSVVFTAPMFFECLQPLNIGVILPTLIY